MGQRLEEHGCAVKVNTKVNLADIFTKCLSSQVRATLMDELARIAKEVSVAVAI